ncbi:uncharacterized protein BX664DRAFT_312294 [Halteromyces radiatus]|uniref:uncharacterized protein n=1 Tax=Halteromyces radiatus TaxID=101107 RepID=UPI00221EE039|nr:uncharacterized protein BX664DRAFT_312294 [Halteromyces radiatus]KAI8097451.1 hypothetical protein BX664DRAFT_312294 [Halteromyces radiatus]
MTLWTFPHASIGPGLQLNAVFFRSIRWEVGDQEFAIFWETTGLPNDHRQRNFMVWLLGFIHADGHVTSRWKNTYTDPQLQMDYIILAARDRGILIWIKKMLVKNLIFYTMKISGQMNESHFKIGITALQEEPFNEPLDIFSGNSLYPVIAQNFYYLKSMKFYSHLEWKLSSWPSTWGALVLRSWTASRRIRFGLNIASSSREILLGQNVDNKAKLQG